MVYLIEVRGNGRIGSSGVGTVDKKAAEGYHVLVVDDDQSLASVIAETLEQIDSDLRTTYTSDPRQALARLQADAIDCLVTDYEMPELDGLALVDRDTTDTPFIVFTQCRDDGVASAVADRGGAYLQKGASREQYRRLATLVHEQLPE